MEKPQRNIRTALITSLGMRLQRVRALVHVRPGATSSQGSTLLMSEGVRLVLE